MTFTYLRWLPEEPLLPEPLDQRTFADLDEADAAQADALRETLTGLPARPGVTR